LKKTFRKINKLSKQLVLLVFDAVFVNLGYFLTAYILFAGDIPQYLMNQLLSRAPFVTLAYLLVFRMFGLYSSIWQYAGMHELMQCAGAVLTGSILGVGIDAIGKNLKIPRLPISTLTPAVYFTGTLTIAALIGGLRLLYRAARRKQKHTSLELVTKEKRVMIVGAGTMGMIIISELEANGFRLGRPVVVVDDNTEKQGKRLRGVPVRGGCEKIPELAVKYAVDEIIICLPSAAAERQTEVIKIALETGCVLKTSPSLHEMQNEKPNLSTIRHVEITDLLPRPEVELDSDICSYLKDQVVLITGGGGSIGSELCRQAALYEPAVIVIFDNYENNAFSLKNQLDNKYKGSPEIVIRIGSVQDENRLKEVFDEFKPTVVFHAAAHKHVPLMEESPCEAVKNNIFGTYNTAKAALKANVRKFIILSTDKAVNPANVMGATKRVTELIIQYFDRHSENTRFAAVRFGNVLGSNGSVIPIFKEQIEHGGPVTVTDPNITRYFMTIPEAAQLVVQAGGLSKGGEVFVLDMGDPVKILSLAENLIRLSGYTPYLDMDIRFTGLRQGEKLFEELTLAEEMEGRQMTANNKIFVTTPVEVDEELFISVLEKLRAVDNDTVRPLLKKIVPNYAGLRTHEEFAAAEMA